MCLPQKQGAALQSGFELWVRFGQCLFLDGKSPPTGFDGIDVTMLGVVDIGQIQQDTRDIPVIWSKCRFQDDQRFLEELPSSGKLTFAVKENSDSSQTCRYLGMRFPKSLFA